MDPATTETNPEAGPGEVMAKEAKYGEEISSTADTIGHEDKANSEPIDNAEAIDKVPLLHENGGAGTRSHTPIVNEVDDVDSFKKAAITLLSIHRDEISQRDEQISMLRGELLRVREGLQALEKQSFLANPFQRYEGDGGQEWMAVQTNTTPATEIGKDPQEQIFRQVQRIWESCLKTVEGVMAQDSPQETMSDWSMVEWPEKEQMPDILALPPEPSNGTSARRTRAMLVMTLLAKALEEYTLTPNYLFEDDDELRYILHKMTDTKKKAHFRGLLLSISEEEDLKEPVKQFRVESALNSIIKPIQALFQEDFCDKLRSSLEQLLDDVMIDWEPVQRAESHFEVSTVAKGAGREWMSLWFDGDTANLVTVNSSGFEADPVLMVLFPRMCVIDRTKKPAFTTVFPGVVFQKSQVAVADTDADVNDVEVPAALNNELITTEPQGGPMKEAPAADEADLRVTGSESEGSSASGDETDGGSETESNDGDE